MSTLLWSGLGLAGANLAASLWLRPLCASGMDKLELQDCLEHGRVAKVRVLTHTHTHLSRSPEAQPLGELGQLVTTVPVLL